MNSTSPEMLCRRILKIVDPAQRDRALRQAARTPACLSFSLETARNAIPDRPEEALQFSTLAVEIAQRWDDLISASAAWRCRAQALRAAGRHLEAIAAFETAAENARRAGDARLAAQVQIGTIDSLGWLGRYEEAFALAGRLEQELVAGGAEADAAKVLVNAGNLHYRRDEYTQALDSYERARNILADSEDDLAIARIQANSANILAQLNRVEESLAQFEQARAVFTAHDLGAMAAMVDASAGYLRYLSGEHSAALAALTRARREFARRDQELETAKCDADMADIYRELNLGPEALECYERAIPVFDRFGIVYERARAELGRAAVLMTLDRAEAAFTALQAADALFVQQRNRMQRAHVRLIRAYMFHALDRTAEAGREAHRVARTLAKQGAGGWAAAARLLSAEIALNEGEDVARRLHGVSRAARHHSRRWLVCRAQRALGIHYLRKGAHRQAIRHFRSGVEALEEARTLIASEELHIAFLRDKLAVYEDLVGALLARGRPADLEEALECVERSKSRLLLERIQTALDRRATEGLDLNSREHERLAALRAELSRGYHQIYSSEEGAPSRLIGTADTSASLPDLERAYRAELRELEMTGLASAPVAITLSTPIPTHRLRDALQEDETLIEYYITHETIGAFILNRKEVQVRDNLAHLNCVGLAARKLRYQLQRAGLQAGYVRSHTLQMQAGIEEALRELYDQLLAPLRDLLQTEKLILVPHGSLHSLPFHAFYDGVDYALDRYEFLYAPSAAIWHAGVRRRQAQQWDAGDADLQTELLIMGVPEPQIAHVAREVRQVADLFPEALSFCGANATTEAFRLNAGRCRLIHLATHALFRKDNPLFSGLRFADGWLMAHDLYSLPLRCELATLSACRTGTAFVEAGDELLGLTRGFLGAGARSVAASLWPADDAAAAALMARFYGLLTQGMSRAAALRAAQRDLRAEYPHPYHWAAFTLTGER